MGRSRRTLLLTSNDHKGKVTTVLAVGLQLKISLRGNMRSVRVDTVSAILAVGLLTTGVAPSTAIAESTTGCPENWPLRTVESLAATGNEPVPGQIDAAGNADGFVCARPLPDAVCAAHGFDPCPVETVYLFRDNDVPGR